LSLAGTPVLLTDTAGLRHAGDQVEAIGVSRAQALVKGSDVLLWLGDPAEAPEHSRLLKVHAKADIRGSAPEGSLAVSSVTGEGLKPLLEEIAAQARTLLPAVDAIALNRRQAHHIDEAARALGSAAKATDLVFVAEELRHARSDFDRLTGRAGVEHVLDALFARFCLGK
jgi:tRNA modification GTPase